MEQQGVGIVATIYVTIDDRRQTDEINATKSIVIIARFRHRPNCICIIVVDIWLKFESVLVDVACVFCCFK